MQTAIDRRHQVLKDLSSDLENGFIEETFEVEGRQWMMRTLNDGEETWSDKFVAASNAVAMLTTRRAAKLAVAIRAVNDVPLDQLFSFPEETAADKSVKEYITSDPVRFRFWQAEQMYEFLAGTPSGDEGLVRLLYAKYLELENRVKEVSENLKNSLTSPPIGD